MKKTPEEVCDEYFKYADLVNIQLPKESDFEKVLKIRNLITTFKSFCDTNKYNFTNTFPILIIKIIERGKALRNDYYQLNSINVEALKDELDKVVPPTSATKIVISCLVRFRDRESLTSNKFITFTMLNYFLSKKVGGKEYLDTVVIPTINSRESLKTYIGRFLSTMNDDVYKYLIKENFLAFPNRNFFTNTDKNSEMYDIEEKYYLADVSNRSIFQYRCYELNESYIKSYVTVILSNDINEERTFKFIKDSSVETTLNVSTFSKMIPGIMMLSKSRDIDTLVEGDILVDLDTAIDRVEKLKECFKFSNRYNNASSELFDYTFSKFLENVYDF